MRGFAELRQRLHLVAEVSQGLALVLVVGPDYRAPEGLARLAEGLSGERRWHRLDQDGPALGARLAEPAQVEGRGAEATLTTLLVHGLEYLETPRRQELEVRLNLLRDTLVAERALVLLWVPRSGYDGFRQRCADLFQWRSLQLELAEGDVPIDPALEQRRRYLAELLERTLVVWSGPYQIYGFPADGEPLRRVWAPAAHHYVMSVERFGRWLLHKRPSRVTLGGLTLMGYLADDLHRVRQAVARMWARAAIDDLEVPLPTLDGVVPLTLSEDERVDFRIREESEVKLHIQAQPASEEVDLAAFLVPDGAYQRMDANGQAPPYVPSAEWIIDQTTIRFPLPPWHPFPDGGALCYGDSRREVLADLEARLLGLAPEVSVSQTPAQVLVILAELALARIEEIPAVASDGLQALWASLLNAQDEADKHRWQRHPGWPRGWFTAGPVDALAALALVARGADEVLLRLERHLEDPNWEAILAMALGRLARQDGPRVLWERAWPAAGAPASLRRMALVLVAAAEAFLPPDQVAPYLRQAEAVLDAATPAEAKSAAAWDLAAALALF